MYQAARFKMLEEETRGAADSKSDRASMLKEQLLLFHFLPQSSLPFCL